MATESLVAQLKVKRSEMMVSEVEDVALRMFAARGFDAVTVEDIASEAQISVRTFYRYFPAKDDLFQVRIDRRSEALTTALAARPADEAPLHSIRLALEEVVGGEDTGLLRRWTTVIAANTTLVRSVLGGIQLKSQPVIAAFFGRRLGVPSDDLVPTMLAAATGGVIQAAQTQWFLEGGDLATRMSEAFEVLEEMRWTAKA